MTHHAARELGEEAVDQVEPRAVFRGEDEGEAAFGLCREPRLAQPLPKSRQGLGEPQPQGAGVPAPRLNPPHAPKTLQSSLMFPDRLY